MRYLLTVTRKYITENGNDSMNKQAQIAWWHENLWWVIVLSVVLLALVAYFIYRLIYLHGIKLSNKSHQVICYGKTYHITHGSHFLPDTPIRTGYKFLGWYKDIDCTKPWYEKEVVNKDMELYPKWDREVE